MYFQIKSVKLEQSNLYYMTKATSNFLNFRLKMEPAVQLFVNALDEVAKHPCMEINSEAQNEVIKLKSCINSNNGLQAEVLWFIGKIEGSVMVDTTRKITSRHFDQMTMKFHAFVNDEEVIQRLKALALSAGCPLKNCELINWLLQKSILQLMLKAAKSSVAPDSQNFDNTTISESEMQVIRYVAGFLVKKLKKRLREDEETILEDLLDMESNESTSIDCDAAASTTVDNASDVDFLSYTKELVDKLDRGGLIAVSDKFYLLIVAMEKIAKPTLEQRRHDLASILEQAISDSGTITMQYEQLVTTEELTEQSKEKIFKVIIQDFVTLRMKSYASAYKFVISKKDQAFSRKSLRHNLDQ